MAGLPVNVGQGTVTGKVVSAEQVPASDADVDAVALGGSVTFTPSVTMLLHTGANTIILAQPITVTLGVDGTFTTKLLATDDIDLNPQDWTYTVSFTLTGTAVRVTPFSITVPSGSTQDLADIAPVATSEGVLMVRGSSAYEVWLGLGNTGTEADFIASLGSGGGYLDHGDQSGAVSYSATIATHALTMTGDTDVTLTGGTNGTTVSVWASGAFVLTVESVEVSTGECVATMVRDAWEVRVIGATGEAPAPGLAVPTASVTGSTESTITITYATATSGTTGWQYSLDSGAPAALDGTSPDTITGLPSSSSGTIKVRYTVDGTTWSDYSTPAAYTTTASPATFFRPTRTDTTNIAESGDGTVGYTYTWPTERNTGNGLYSVAGDKIAAGQDGYFEFVLTGATQFGVSIGYSNNLGGGYRTRPLSISINNAINSTVVNGSTYLNGGTDFAAVSYAVGSTFRVGRSGSTLYLRASTDGFATYTSLASATQVGTEFIDLHLTLGVGTVPYPFEAGSTVTGIKRQVSGTALTVTEPYGPTLRRTNAGNALIIPSVANVAYQIGGATVTGTHTVTGSSVTILPVPAAGCCIYRNATVAGWTYALASDTLLAATSAPAMASVVHSDSFDRADGVPGTSDSATGGTNRTYAVTGGAVIASNQLSLPSAGVAAITASGWTSSQCQIEFDVISASTQVVRVEFINWTVSFELRADGSLAFRNRATSPHGFIGSYVFPGSTTGFTPGRYAFILKGADVTVLGPTGFSHARFTLPTGVAVGNGASVLIKNSAATDIGGNTGSPSAVVIDNLKIGVPA